MLKYLAIVGLLLSPMPSLAQEAYPMDVPVDPPAQTDAAHDAYYAGVPQAPVAPDQVYAEPAPAPQAPASAMDMLYYDSDAYAEDDQASSLVNGLNF